MAEPGAVLMQGALDKKMKSRMRGFKSRWFVLRAKELVYYDSEAAALKSPEAPLGVIPLAVRRVPPPPPPPPKRPDPPRGPSWARGGPPLPPPDRPCTGARRAHGRGLKRDHLAELHSREAPRGFGHEERLPPLV